MLRHAGFRVAGRRPLLSRGVNPREQISRGTKILCVQKRLRGNAATLAMMWDNTRPVMGINPIHIMNEGSFTLLLVMAPRIGRPPVSSPRFATATMEGL